MVGFAITIQVFLASSQIRNWWNILHTKGVFPSDGLPFMTGWRMAYNGIGAHVYEVHAQLRVQNELLHANRPLRMLLVHENPPHLLPLFGLVGRFSLWTGGIILASASLGALLLMLVGAWRFLRHWSRQERVLLVSTIALSGTTLQTFDSFQLAPVWLLGILLACRCAYRGRNWLAALLLLFVTYKVTLLPFLVIGFLVGGHRKVIGRLAVLAAAASAIATALYGSAIWSSYAQLAFRATSVRGGNVAYDIMWNVRGALVAAGLPDHLVQPLSLFVGCAGVVGTIRLWRKPAPGERAYWRRVATTLLITCLCTPYLYHYDAIISFVGIVGIWDIYRHRVMRSRTVFVAIAVSCFFQISINDAPPLVRPATVLLVLLLLASWRSHRRSNDTTEPPKYESNDPAGNVFPAQTAYVADRLELAASCPAHYQDIGGNRR
jgi:hypothetical protein